MKINQKKNNCTVVIAELVPHLNIFISLIGALCSTGNKFSRYH